jgi:type III pantothenate kinase
MKQPGYVLTIFAGNTHVIFGVYAGGRYVGRWRIEARSNRSADEYGTWLFNTFEYVDVDPTLIEGVVMACTSVVAKKMLTKMCERYFDITPLVVGAGIRTGVSINYGRAGDLSANRVANIVGLSQEYQLPAMVVDCDSVTSFDILDSKGTYIGGTITPGIMSSLSMLPQLAPQLPEVSFDYTDKIVGKNIQESLQAGHFWSAVDMIDATVERIWKSLGITNGTVIGTGSYIHEIEDACTCFHAIDTHLLFNGLKEIYNLNAPLIGDEDWQPIELPLQKKVS